MKIGFFDTGLGGTTVFKESYKKINAEFIYLADTLNAPYGTKDKSVVLDLTKKRMAKLIELGCEIIVLACNTATSVAIADLRAQYPNVVFIGAEPAVKPAIENSNGKNVIITATSLTLKGDKLHFLISRLNAQNQVSLLPLDNLVDFADKTDHIQYDLAEKYIIEQLSTLNLNNYSGIVLGCTHFPIFKKVFEKALPTHIKIYEPAEGITNNLIHQIYKLYPNYSCTKKSVTLITTSKSEDFKNKFDTIIMQ